MMTHKIESTRENSIWIEYIIFIIIKLRIEEKKQLKYLMERKEWGETNENDEKKNWSEKPKI